eukprot:COSAG02_NODE_31777_length_527_cov_1.196262_1_plen_47_part_01
MILQGGSCICVDPPIQRMHPARVRGRGVKTASRARPRAHARGARAGR